MDDFDKERISYLATLDFTSYDSSELCLKNNEIRLYLNSRDARNIGLWMRQHYDNVICMFCEIAIVEGSLCDKCVNTFTRIMNNEPLEKICVRFKDIYGGAEFVLYGLDGVDNFIFAMGKNFYVSCLLEYRRDTGYDWKHHNVLTICHTCKKTALCSARSLCEICDLQYEQIHIKLFEKFEILRYVLVDDICHVITEKMFYFIRLLYNMR